MITSIKKISILVLFLCGITACDSLLDPEVDNNFSLNDFSNTENIQRALTGAYFNLGGFEGGELYGGDFILITELISKRSDIGWLVSAGGADHEGFVNHDILKTNPIVEANWVRAYEVINTVNNILDNLDNISDAEDRNRINGEALAIRGILNFEMVRLWAPQYGPASATTPGTPILLNPVTSIEDIQVPERSTVEEVYNQSISDLSAASALLEPFGQNGVNISYYACEAFLARIRMQQNDFASALTHANNILNDNAYTLLNSPLDAFNNLSNSPEDIFAIQQTLANNAGDRSTGIGLTTYMSALEESGFGVFGIIDTHLFETSANFTNAGFARSDLRVQADLSTTTGTTSDQISTAFYRNPVNTGFLASSKYLRADHVIPVVRLAEIHLIRAESIYETNPGTISATALSDLNAIRTRAGLEALDVIDFASAENFYDSIVAERKRELFLEGHLLHDLRRTRQFKNDPEIVIGIKTFGANPLDTDLILPVPQSETDASGLE